MADLCWRGGLSIGALLDFVLGVFPLFMGILMVAAELSVYIWLKNKFGKDIEE